MGHGWPTTTLEAIGGGDLLGGPPLMLLLGWPAAHEVISFGFLKRIKKKKKIFGINFLKKLQYFKKFGGNIIEFQLENLVILMISQTNKYE